MVRRSTTFRLAALVFLFQIVAAAILLLGPALLLRSQSRANAVAVAEAVRDDLLATYGNGNYPALAGAVQFRIARRAERTNVLLLARTDGTPVAGNIDRLPQGLPLGGAYTLVRLTRAGHSTPEAMLVQAVRLADGSVLVTGTVVETERQIMALLERTSMIALGLSVVFAAFAAFLATRLILNRLQASVATLRDVREGRLSRRVPADDTGDAFARLGSEVNQALDRMAALNHELKIATDALAHDLKSPLTRMRAALDRAAQAVEDPQAQPFVDQAVTESERLMAIVETALSITRAEAGMGRESFAESDLSELLATVAEIYEPLVEDHGRAIVVKAPPALHLRVHRQLLDQALGNLIDNTLKYGAGTVTLSLEPDAQGATIIVADQGPGIEAKRREQALRRFSRLDEARGGWGAGLGLSLVQAVAHLHGGQVELQDAAPGLAVRVRLLAPPIPGPG